MGSSPASRHEDCRKGGERRKWQAIHEPLTGLGNTKSSLAALERKLYEKADSLNGRTGRQTNIQGKYTWVYPQKGIVDPADRCSWVRATPRV